jgi:hypothetical protein
MVMVLDTGAALSAAFDALGTAKTPKVRAVVNDPAAIILTQDKGVSKSKIPPLLPFHALSNL